MDEIKTALETMHKNWEDFKRDNDAKISDIQKKGFSDPLLTEKVEKTNTAITEFQKRLDELEIKSKRAKFTANAETDNLKLEHKAAFLQWMRKGKDNGLLDLEKKVDLNITTGAQGEYALPELIDRAIVDRMQNFSPMRQLARVIQVSTPDYKQLVNVHGATTGWVDENDSRTATDTSQFFQASAYMGELYAFPQATQQALDDVFFNAEQWLAEETAMAFAIAEGTAFVSGSGTKQPKGFLSYTSAATADASRTYGQIQHIATGTAGAFKTPSATVSQVDDLITMIYATKPGLRQGAVFLMNSATLGVVRTWKSYGDGAYLWQPALVAGQPGTLLGYPCYTEENMPDVGSAAKPIAFGNFPRAYTIVDRIGIRSLRDPYTNKPYVGFYVTKRVGGMLVDSDAVKVIKMSAS